MVEKDVEQKQTSHEVAHLISSYEAGDPDFWKSYDDYMRKPVTNSIEGGENAQQF